MIERKRHTKRTSFSEKSRGLPEKRRYYNSVFWSLKSGQFNDSNVFSFYTPPKPAQILSFSAIRNAPADA